MRNERIMNCEGNDSVVVSNIFYVHPENGGR